MKTTIDDIDIKIQKHNKTTKELFDELREAELNRYKNQQRNWNLVEIAVAVQFVLLTFLMMTYNETVAMVMSACYMGFVLHRTASIKKNKKKNGIVK